MGDAETLLLLELVACSASYGAQPLEATPERIVEYHTPEVQQRQNLSAAATWLLDYIERHANAVLVSSALELAAKINASDATVIRSIQTLGFDGLPHLKTVSAEKLDEGTRTPVEKVSVSKLTQDGSRPPPQMVVEAYAKTLERLSRPTLPKQFQPAALLQPRPNGRSPSSRSRMPEPALVPNPC
ncbi:hypothetical protein GFL68_35535 [Rhizobium laguerreae]|nr:hypothetical protein [Rhizobium laguerreae]